MSTLSNAYEVIILNEAQANTIMQAGFPMILHTIFQNIRGENENVSSLFGTYTAFVNNVKTYSERVGQFTDNMERLTSIEKVRESFLIFCETAQVKIPLILSGIEKMLYGETNSTPNERLLISAVGSEKTKLLNDLHKFFVELLPFIQRYEDEVKNISKVNLDRYFNNLHTTIDKFIKQFNAVSKYLNSVLKITYHGNLFNKISGFIKNFIDFKALMA